MKLSIPIPKQVLRLILGLLAFLLPVALPLSMLLTGADRVLLPTISTYYYSDVSLIYLIILLLFGLGFILYGLTVTRDRLILLAVGILTFIIAFIPTYKPHAVEHSWTGHFHIICAAILFALLGWVIKNTFNLPLGFSLLSKIGTWIWIVEVILFIYFLAFKSLWPPLVYLLETVILWLFTAGIYVRHQIDKKLGG